ncbi:MAG: iron-containing alcohol dehydrogenase [Planctomycetes bacterium]|nr:iron-containing alcohol dehydrogenase [Planctomycetota bacterium]
MSSLPILRSSIDTTLVYHAECRSKRDYEVHLVDDAFAANGPFATRIAAGRVLVVSTPTVWANFGERLLGMQARLGSSIAVRVLVVEEQSKSIDNVMAVCAACREHGLGRTDTLVALGGGVCHDIVALAASLVRRGLRYLCVPTTLVGQIDAGVGIKGAVNYLGGKSYLGCFHPPDLVVLDPSLLATAPPRTQLDGVAEAIKIALIDDPLLFSKLEGSDTEPPGVPQIGDRKRLDFVVWRAAAKMLQQLTPNFFEDQSYHRCVDLGHTFSPLLEERSGYTLTHGQAVSIDMALSASIATGFGLLSRDTFRRILRLLRACDLPLTSPLLDTELSTQALVSAALHRGGTPNLVIPYDIGECGFVEDLRALGPSVLERALARVLTDGSH